MSDDSTYKPITPGDQWNVWHEPGQPPTTIRAVKVGHGYLEVKVSRGKAKGSTKTFKSVRAFKRWLRGNYGKGIRRMRF